MKNYVQSYSSFSNIIKINESYNPIDEDTFNNLIDTSYTFLNSDFKPDFYRGIDSLEKIILINTDDYIRYSKGADKITAYNYWIDNQEDWKEYPKRSRGIICSNVNDIANEYGNVYKIFPLSTPEKFKAGVCPTSDIWRSYVKGFESGFEIFNRGHLNVNYLFVELSMLVDSLGIKFSNFFELLNIIQERYIDKISEFDTQSKFWETEESRFLNKASDTVKTIIDYCVNNKLNILQQFNIVFNPKVNEFKLINYSNIESFYKKLNSGEVRNAREIWFEGPAIAVLLEEDY